MKPKIYKASEVQPETRVSPAQRIIDSLDGEYKTMRETSEIVGVHIETLRRLCRTGKISAPSMAAKSGKLVVYLFTDEDVEEVKNYFNHKGMLIESSKPHGSKKD